MKRTDPERDSEEFQEWSQSLPDEQFVEYATDWMCSLQAGTLLACDGLKTFEGWLHDKRWASVREARELQRLDMLADLARAA